MLGRTTTPGRRASNLDLFFSSHYTLRTRFSAAFLYCLRLAQMLPIYFLFFVRAAKCSLSVVSTLYRFSLDPRTALIVGGGDGVGKLHDIATKVRIDKRSDSLFPGRHTCKPVPGRARCALGVLSPATLIGNALLFTTEVGECGD